MNITIMILAGLLGITLLWYVSRTKQHSIQDFFVGDRHMNGFVLALTLVATYGSVSSFVSGPGVAYTHGLSWVIFAAPQIIAGFFMLAVVGRKIALIGQRIRALSLIDLLAQRYPHPLVKRTFAALLTIVLFVMMVGQILGGTRFLSSSFHWPYEPTLWGLTITTIFLTIIGGLRSVAYSDVLCAILMLISTGVLGYTIADTSNGFQTAFQNITQEDPSLFTPTHNNSIPWPLLFSAWWLVGFGTVALPQSLQRLFGISHSRSLYQGTMISTVVCAVMMLSITLLGFLIRGVPQGVPSGLHPDLIVGSFMANHFHGILLGILIIGPLAATLSTCSSLLLSVGCSVLLDFFPAQKSSVWSSRLLILALGLAVGYFAKSPNEIVVWINMAAFGGLQVIFFWPLLLGLYWPRANRVGLWCSLITGLTTYTLGLSYPSMLLGFHAVIPAIGLAGLSFYLGSRFSLPRKQQTLRLYFSQRRLKKYSL